MMNPFTPGATVTLAVTAVTGSVALSRGTNAQQIRIASAPGGQIAFVVFGTSAVTATAAGLPILPGTIEVFTVPIGATYAAAITASSTATLYFTSGDGQ